MNRRRSLLGDEEGEAGLVNHYLGEIDGGQVKDIVGNQHLDIVGTVTASGGWVNVPGNTSNYLEKVGHSALNLTVGTLWLKMKAPPASLVRAMGFADNFSVLYFGEVSAALNNEAAFFLIASPTDSDEEIEMGATGLGNDFLLDNAEHTVGVRCDGVDNAIFIDGIKRDLTFLHGTSPTTGSGFFINGGGVKSLELGIITVQGSSFGGGSYEFAEIKFYNKALTDAEIIAQG